jgi:hypothetical protein
LQLNRRLGGKRCFDVRAKAWLRWGRAVKRRSAG